MGLTDEQRRRIEREEQQRLEEEQYRVEVRRDLESAPQPPPRSTHGGFGRMLLILVVLGVIAYILVHNSK